VYVPSAVVDVSAKLPPTRIGRVPALPIAPLKLWLPLVLGVSVTTMVSPPLVKSNVEGTETEKLWPPSPVAVKLAAVEAGEGILVTPVPVVVTAPVAAASDTVPLPVRGRVILPNASADELVIAIERKTLAVASPASDPPWVPSKVVALTAKFAVDGPLLAPPLSPLSGKSKPT